MRLLARPCRSLPLLLRFPPPRRRRAPIRPGSGPIVAALAWLQGTLLGNVATAVAVMAVAAVGFMMLTGRMNWRFGATVIIGCFILFGAASIVAGIQSAAAVGLSAMELIRHPVHRALTRPQMFAGVTYNFFIINAAVTTELFLITSSFLALAGRRS